MKKYFSTILVVTALFISAAHAASPILKDLDGKQRTLDEFTGHGKWAVALIWASDCHVCNAEAEQYIQFHEENKNKKIHVVGISMDGKNTDKARAFIKRHDVTFPNLIGGFEEVASMYENMTGGAWGGTPTILIFNPAGELKAAQPGAVPVELIQQYIDSQELTANSVGKSTK